jgi:hypothetical protein
MALTKFVSQMIDVVTVFAPRREHPQWMDYIPLLSLQRDSAVHFGHRHIVVTDDAEPEGLRREFSTMTVDLPHSLMRAQIAGQVAYLEQWTGDHPAVLVDADCLITRALDAAFDGTFDLGLTHRDDPVSPIQNGAMYVAPGNKEGVLRFFRGALAICGDHWGGDQEAISAMAAPVPKLSSDKHERRSAKTIVESRPSWATNSEALRIGFLNGLDYNVSPKVEGKRHARNPFVVHFKGETKAWMKTYAQRFVLGK